MKKGFTIMELLGVITILAILMIMAVPAMLSISAKNKEKMYCKKIQTAVKAAQMYGQDSFHYIDQTVFEGGTAARFLIDNNLECVIGGEKIDHCQITTIGNLADRGYLKLEKVGKSGVESEFLDPRNFSSMLEDKVVVYVVNRRVNAQFIYNSQKDGNICAESIQVGNSRYKTYYYKEGTEFKKS